MAASALLLGSEAHDRPATVASSVDLIAHGEGPEWRLQSIRRLVKRDCGAMTGSVIKERWRRVGLSEEAVTQMV